MSDEKTECDGICYHCELPADELVDVQGVAVGSVMTAFSGVAMRTTSPMVILCFECTVTLI